MKSKIVWSVYMNIKRIKFSTLHETDFQNDFFLTAPEILNTIKWSQSLDEIFIKNFLEDRNLKWQYFGSQTGVFRSYPGNCFRSF